jgi:hypothetical protein
MMQNEVEPGKSQGAGGDTLKQADSWTIEDLQNLFCETLKEAKEDHCNTDW